MNYLKLGELLYNFEVKRFTAYREQKLGKWNSWPILRRPLYYYLIINKLKGKEDSAPNQGKKVTDQYRLKTLLINFFSFIFKFLHLLIFHPRKELAIVFPFTVDKSFRNEAGKYVDILIDPLIQEKILKNFIYVEASNDGQFIRPALIKPDLIADGLLLPILILRKFFSRTVKFRKISLFYETELNTFFKSESCTIEVSQHEVRDLLAFYWAEKCIYKFIFYLLTPKLSLFNDELFSGKMTAALEAGAKVIELQHGFIGNFKPDYFISGQLKKIKSEVPLCHKLGVFGQFHRENITYPGFWSEKEVIDIGNYRIETAREKPFIKADAEFTILFPTQWHVFEESKTIIQTLIGYVISNNLRLIIKAHPRESGANLKWYKDLADAQSTHISFYTNEKDIYELLQISDFLVGFDSTTLLEAIAIGIPTITISTAMVPEGIHSYLWTDKLKNAIKISSSGEDLLYKIDSFRLGVACKQEWLMEIKKQGEYLYASNYSANVKNMVAEVLFT